MRPPLGFGTFISQGISSRVWEDGRLWRFRMTTARDRRQVCDRLSVTVQGASLCLWVVVMVVVVKSGGRPRQRHRGRRVISPHRTRWSEAYCTAGVLDSSTMAQMVSWSSGGKCGNLVKLVGRSMAGRMGSYWFGQKEWYYVVYWVVYCRRASIRWGWPIKDFCVLVETRMD